MKETIILLAVPFLMGSCVTSTGALNNLRTISNRIDWNGPTYTKSDWDKMNTKYKKVDNSISKHIGKGSYTPNERDEISRLQNNVQQGIAQGTGKGTPSQTSSGTSNRNVGSQTTSQPQQNKGQDAGQGKQQQQSTARPQDNAQDVTRSTQQTIQNNGQGGRR